MILSAFSTLGVLQVKGQVDPQQIMRILKTVILSPLTLQVVATGLVLALLSSISWKATCLRQPPIQIGLLLSSKIMKSWVMTSASRKMSITLWRPRILTIQERAQPLKRKLSSKSCLQGPASLKKPEGLKLSAGLSAIMIPLKTALGKLTTRMSWGRLLQSEASRPMYPSFLME